MLELVFLFIVGAFLYSILQSVSTMDEIVKMAIMVVVLYVLFAILDIILDKVFRLKKLFILVRRDDKKA